MTVRELYDAADEIAPFALSREYCEKYGGHDNSGILVNCGKEVKKVLFSLDCSLSAVAEAKRTGADAIFTHHPAIFYPVSSLTEDDAVLRCAGAGISVLSAHLNLDCAAGGIDESLMLALGGDGAEKTMHELSRGGYGRVYGVKQTSLQEFVSRARMQLNTQRIVFYGDAPVKKVASFCGAGFDEESIRFALANGADTVVSSDAKHHLVAMAAERGLNVVLLTHYAAEQYGFYRFYSKIKLSGVEKAYFADGRLM